LFLKIVFGNTPLEMAFKERLILENGPVINSAHYRVFVYLLRSTVQRSRQRTPSSRKLIWNHHIINWVILRINSIIINLINLLNRTIFFFRTINTLLLHGINLQILRFILVPIWLRMWWQNEWLNLSLGIFLFSLFPKSCIT
jgi:hypothetical protein